MIAFHTRKVKPKVSQAKKRGSEREEKRLDNEGACSVGNSLLRHYTGALEAQRYEQYEQARLQHIHSKVAAGVKELTLAPPYPTAPQDKLGLIRCMDLESDAKTYPNFIAKDHYKMESISQKR